MEIEEALEEFCLQLEADGRSSHTKANYSRHVRQLAGWLGATGRGGDVRAVGHRDVAAYLASDVVRLLADGRPRKPSSTNGIKSSLRAFFGFLHAAGHIQANPTRLVRRAVCAPAPPRALSEGEQSRLLEALGGAQTGAERRDAVLFKLLLWTGARLGAVLKADVEDLSLEEGELRLRYQKGGREGAVYLRDELVTALVEWVGEKRSGPLFPGQAGAPLTHRQAARRLQGWLERAGIDRKATPHSLRHTFATSLYAETGDVLVVKDALHHRSLHSSLIYTGPAANNLKQRVVEGWQPNNSSIVMETRFPSRSSPY